MTDPQFTGETELVPLHAFPDTGVRVSEVNFEAGSVTHWHSHQNGQVVYVVAGECRTQVRGGEVRILRPGEWTSVEGGVEHWHGATEDGPMTHVVANGGDPTWGPAPEV